MSDALVNKVAESGIITLDLEDYYPKEPVAVFDLKPYLFMEMILKEKDFREALKNADLTAYQGKHIALTCSADAIIPMWAWMLVVSALQPVAKQIHFGNEAGLKETLLLQNLLKINAADYHDKRVVIKGCGETPIPESAYVEITRMLRPVAKSIMFGEPCSTVPVFKRKES